jgi:hypothetical protein
MKLEEEEETCMTGSSAVYIFFTKRYQGDQIKGDTTG